VIMSRLVKIKTLGKIEMALITKIMYEKGDLISNEGLLYRVTSESFPWDIGEYFTHVEEVLNSKL